MDEPRISVVGKNVFSLAQMQYRGIKEKLEGGLTRSFIYEISMYEFYKNDQDTTNLKLS
jgi:hypothetical protein